MGLTVRTLRDQQATNVAGAFVSDRRLWLTADRSRVVEDGSPEAAFLLVGPGGAITVEMAKAFAISRDDAGAVILADSATPAAAADPKVKSRRRAK